MTDHCTSHAAMSISFRLLRVSSRLLRLTAMTTLSMSVQHESCATHGSHHLTNTTTTIKI